MARKLQIRDLPDRLEFQITERYTRAGIALAIVVDLAIAAVWLYLSRQEPLLFIFGLIVIPYGSYKLIQQVVRGADVTLTVTARDTMSEGYTSGDYAPCNLDRLKVDDFSYGNPNSENDERPDGLYVGGICVLPIVKEAEALMVIEAIYDRYPDTASLSAGDYEEKPSGLTSLGLNR